MGFVQAIIVFLVAWLALSFWAVLACTLALVIRSVRAGTFATCVVFVAALSIQNPPAWAMWLKFSPTHLMSWLEPIMLNTSSTNTLIVAVLLTLLGIIILGGISTITLRRHFIQ